MSGPIFHEVRLPHAMRYTSRGGPGLSTHVNPSPGGGDRTAARWEKELRKYRYEGRVNGTTLRQILAFALARKGQHIRFRLWDPSDYWGENEYLGAGDGTASTFQLVKHYTDSVTPYAIKAVNAGSDTVTCEEIDEENAAAGSFVRIAGSTGNDGTYKVTAKAQGSYAVAAVNQGAKKFTVAGDKTAEFSVNQLITVSGSTGNDGEYRIYNVGLNGGDTEIVVKSALASAVADGSILANTVLTLSPGFADSTADGRVETFWTRTIKKPVSGAHQRPGYEAQSGVLVAVDGVAKTEGTHYAVDYTRGEITFTPGNIPTAGQRVVGASFEYDVPVRFDTDDFKYEFVKFDQFSFSWPIVEDRL